MNSDCWEDLNYILARYPGLIIYLYQTEIRSTRQLQYLDTQIQFLTHTWIHRLPLHIQRNKDTVLKYTPGYTDKVPVHIPRYTDIVPGHVPEYTLHRYSTHTHTIPVYTRYSTLTHTCIHRYSTRMHTWIHRYSNCTHYTYLATQIQ